MYEFNTIEPEILKFWKDNNIHSKVNEKNKKGKKFYFLDGPPYTSGKVHIGTAWNKSMKDLVLRYKRMNGYNVWDRAGYDMHGLPIEHATEKKLGIEGKREIEKFGVQKFIDECEKLSTENLKNMNKDFIRLGVWMDFENAYQPINEKNIEATWWLIKQAQQNNRLYEGERAMSWCRSCATALAKHELEYQDLNDESIFLKFKIKDSDHDFLLVWTTTPWTIPLNLAVVVHPDFQYVKCRVDNENWIIAKKLAKQVIEDKAGRTFTIINEFNGKKLEGTEYIPAFPSEFQEIIDAKKTQPLVHTVLLSEEYVHLEEGTGLVHFAPGCGEADYELCVRRGIKPFNVIDEHGAYPDHKLFGGLIAKKDDNEFIQLMKDNGSLITQEKINHSYAHCWRCKTAIVYKTTKQWFFKVEDLKSKLIEDNKKINWIPTAAFNAFDAWLTNLRDNSITKQRYWGTPLPIWRCDACSKIELLATKKEIEEKIHKPIPRLHKPWIDAVTWQCKCGGQFIRISDVMDVWIDPGCASWICLNYPHQQELFEKYFPADFIIEGKDQFRGWFNVLQVCSAIGLSKSSFKTCYVHGFVQDSQGRKMSKSLGNVISPYEVIDKYGADTFRYYSIGGANPAIDLNYNFEDLKIKHRNLMILINVQNFIIGLANELNIVTPDLNPNCIKPEERYILSKLNSNIRLISNLMDKYRINEVPWKIEEIYLELSRTYIQLVRDKAALGSKTEKNVVFTVGFHVYFEILKMFSIVCPFLTEKLYQSLKERFKLSNESIHMYAWPIAKIEMIDSSLETQFEIYKDITQAAMHAREKAQLGLRWPLKELVIITDDSDTIKSIEILNDIIEKQINVKKIRLSHKEHPDTLEFTKGKLFLNTESTPELEAEGFAREIMRRIQSLRKKSGLQRLDSINLIIKTQKNKIFKGFEQQIREKCGCKKLDITDQDPEQEFEHSKTDKIKDIEFEIKFNKD